MIYKVDFKNKVIFACNPKCGCVHIKTIFRYIVGNDNYNWNKNKPKNVKWNEFTLILIIRNPYKRIISGFINEYFPFQSEHKGLFFHKWNKNKKLTFFNFVKELENSNFEVIDKFHFEKQINKNDIKLINNIKKFYIFDIENIDYQIIENICHIKLPENIISFKGPHSNKNTKFLDKQISNFELQEYCDYKINTHNFYNKDLERKIYNFYKLDFDFFKKYNFYYQLPSLKKTDLVIAFYNEIENIPIFVKYSNIYKYRLIIYNKGNINNNILKDTIINSGLIIEYQIFKLPNIGLNTHTYLYHIIKNYYDLEYNTIFILGSAFRDPKKTSKANYVLKNGNNCSGFMASHIWKTSKEEFNFELPYYEIFNYKNKKILSNSERINTKMIRADTLPLGEWIRKYTHSDLKDNTFYRSNKCMFCVNKKIILNRDYKYWKNLYDLLNVYPSNVRNLEVIHFFERAWVNIFIKNPTFEVLNYDYNKYK